MASKPKISRKGVHLGIYEREVRGVVEFQVTLGNRVLSRHRNLSAARQALNAEFEARKGRHTDHCPAACA